MGKIKAFLPRDAMLAQYMLSISPSLKSNKK